MIFQAAITIKAPYMKPHIRYLHFFYSAIIIAFCYGLFRFLFQPGNDPVNHGVSVYFLILVISSVAIAAAAGMILLRYLKRYKFRESFFYNLTGVANFCLGAGYLFLLFRDRLDGTSLPRFAFNLVLGTIMIADIILSSDSAQSE